MPPTASFAAEMRRIVEGDVRFDAGSLAAYSTDASNYRQVPVGVVRPRHIDDVIRAVALARENGVPIVGRGGGTSLAGQACNAALVMDFSRYMTAIHAIDPKRQSATVEGGVVQSKLNAQAADYGLFFAPDPATKDRCTLGGMIGNNSCGAHSAAYGKTVDNVLALDVLLYDGTRLHLGAEGAGSESADLQGAENIQAAIDSTGRAGEIYSQSLRLAVQYAKLIRTRFPRIPRRVSGYNLDELLPENGFNLARSLVGSEGTLALVLGATVKLVPIPKELVLVVLGFADIFEAADHVPWLLEHRPEALEAFDHNLVEFGQTKRLPSLRLLPQGGAFLIAELGGASRDEARERGEALLSRARQTKGLVGGALFTDAQERAAVWGLRESGLGAGAPREGHPRVWPGAEDCAVAPAKLGQYLRRFDQLLQRRGLSVAMYYGHFGQGCIHCRINFDLTSAAGIANFRSAMLEIGDLITEHGGSISGEHGDGIARSELLPRMFGPELMRAFAEFKTIFDPEGRMNPGVIVDPLPMDSHLRLGAGYQPKQIETHFDFSADGGLGGAVSRCVGIGKCRKLDSGAMCPSYMVTRDELLSTRGRAHMLFEALNGDLLPSGFGDEALHDTLKLCLSCKSCKSECPASVDMASYKAEFLSHYYRTHRRPFGDELFATVFRWAPLAALVPGLSNFISSSALGSMAKEWLGVHPERALPRLAPRSFRQWFASHPRSPQGREVLLFPDTFNNFFEPDVAIAAVEVLERAGFRVTIPPKYVCCGRPLYDQGMLDEAKLQLAKVMQVLRPWLERGTPIVGLEPGCILTFRDELPRLYPNDPLAAALTRRSFMFEEFLALEAPDFTPPARSATALLQAHCHHRSIVGMETEIALLRRIEGLKLEVLDSGCCGLAGAFGYAKENYEISRALAERVLLPSIRNSAPETLVVADGFSCRSQIRHFCPGTRVRHLAQMLTDE